jgi:hypothetical protein
MAKETAKETEDDENPLPKKKVVKKQEDEQEQAHDDEEKRPAKRKKLASSDDAASDDNSVSDSSDDAADTHRGEALSLGERAVDVILGLSLNRRSMSFASSPGLANKPAPYNGVPVAGAYIDGTVFPLAIGHKREGLVKNFGATLMYDRVLKIESKASGVTYPTTASRYAVGLAFRYPIGHKLVIGARVRYGSRAFTISKVNGEGPGIPNVAYTIIDPTVTFAYQAAPKIAIDAKLGFMAITNTGEIQKPDQYGAATVSGVEGDVGVSYRFANNLFARAAFSFETIGFSFKGTGMLSDPNGDMMKDVSGARDTYLGGSVTAGVLY